jgi:hypothetical protein
VPHGGGERGVRYTKTFGGLWVAEVLRLPTNMGIGVPATVLDFYVEN